MLTENASIEEVSTKSQLAKLYQEFRKQADNTINVYGFNQFKITYSRMFFEQVVAAKTGKVFTGLMKNLGESYIIKTVALMNAGHAISVDIPLRHGYVTGIRVSMHVKTNLKAVETILRKSVTDEVKNGNYPETLRDSVGLRIFSEGSHYTARRARRVLDILGGTELDFTKSKNPAIVVTETKDREVQCRLASGNLLTWQLGDGNLTIQNDPNHSEIEEDQLLINLGVKHGRIGLDSLNYDADSTIPYVSTSKCNYYLIPIERSPFTLGSFFGD